MAPFVDFGLGVCIGSMDLPSRFEFLDVTKYPLLHVATGIAF
jgi:hypothetical protein